MPIASLTQPQLGVVAEEAAEMLRAWSAGGPTWG